MCTSPKVSWEIPKVPPLKKITQEFFTLFHKYIDIFRHCLQSGRIIPASLIHNR